MRSAAWWTRIGGTMIGLLNVIVRFPAALKS